MRLHVIGTGSKANSYTLTFGNGRALLLDAGVPVRAVQMAMGKAWHGLAGVLITHDHGDHARSVKDYIPLGIPVYAAPGTRKELHIPAIIPVEPKRSFYIPDPINPNAQATIMAMPFRVQHDAPDAIGYLIQDMLTHERIIYATDFSCRREDIGRYKIPGVHYWIVECNYCTDLIDPEDPIDKRRTENHMSLERLKDILRVNDMATARKIVLCHLSDLRADEARMIREVQEQTYVDTIAARNGMRIDLDLTPF